MTSQPQRDLRGTIRQLGQSLELRRTAPGELSGGYYTPGETMLLTTTAIVVPAGHDADGRPKLALQALDRLQAASTTRTAGPQMDADAFFWHGHRYLITSVSDWSQLGFYAAEALQA